MHATERVERPGESQEALDGKKTVDSPSAMPATQSEHDVTKCHVCHAVRVPRRQRAAQARHQSRCLRWTRSLTVVELIAMCCTFVEGMI